MLTNGTLWVPLYNKALVNIVNALTMSNLWQYLLIFVSISCSLLVLVSSGPLNNVIGTTFDFNSGN